MESIIDKIDDDKKDDDKKDDINYIMSDKKDIIVTKKNLKLFHLIFLLKMIQII